MYLFLLNKICFRLISIISICFCVLFQPDTLFSQIDYTKISNDSILTLLNQSFELINDKKSKDSSDIKKGVKLLMDLEYFAKNSEDSLLLLRVYLKKIELQLPVKKETKKYLDKAISLLEKFDAPHERAELYHFIGIYYSLFNEKEKMLKKIEAYLEAEKLYQKYGNAEENVAMDFNLAISYSNLEQWQNSLTFCLKGLEAEKKANHPEIKKFFIIFSLSNYAYLNKLELARPLIPIVKSFIATENNNPKKNSRIVSKAHQALSAYYFVTNQFKLASAHFRYAANESKNHYEHSYQDHINYTNVKYNLYDENQKNQKIVIENKLHKSQIEYNLIKLKQYKTIGIYSFILILALTSLVCILKKSNNDKRKLNKLLKENYKTVLQANEKTQKALEMHTLFLKNMTHELRTPINSIIGASFLLHKNNLLKYRKHLEHLTFTGNRLLALVNNILNSNLHFEKSKASSNGFITDCNIQIPPKINHTLPKQAENKSNIKILLVEDNKINQIITSKIIKGFGFNCDTANNGIEAIEQHKNNTYDLILMDIMMPVMGGLEASQIITQGNPNINIIALTALSINELKNEEDYINSGIKAIITKPLQPEELHKEILNHLAHVQYAQ